MSEFSYNYNSYTSDPNVIRTYPKVDINYTKDKKWTNEKSFNVDNSNVKKEVTIEELAEIILTEKEKVRGFKFSSKERRTMKRSIINDIKKGKIMQTKANIEKIFCYLERLYPNPQCELNFKTPFQLLIAVILSAQCTDKRVNEVTPVLFDRYPTPQDLANAKQAEVEEIIHSLGFFRNKSKAIIECSKQVVEKFNGEIPNDIKELQKLSGVGRKTANVVTAEAFGANNIGVDTHIFRVSHRLNLSQGKTPEKVEEDLRKQLKNRQMNIDHFRMVLFGRYHCKAMKPNCQNCELNDICLYYKDKC